jgi:hypothetical protein
LKNDKTKYLLRIIVFSLVVLGNIAMAQPSPQAPPADVSGKWTISSRNTRGQLETKFIDVIQNGNAITGYFKGPDQSGPIEGTINEQHILFRTKTPNVLTFRGRVDGPRVDGRVVGKRIDGTFHLHTRTAEWHAVRSD